MADWTDVPGFEGKYQISRHGDVRYTGEAEWRKGKLLKQAYRQNGYSGCVTVRLMTPDGKSRVERSVAVLMAHAWIRPVTMGDLIIHVDGNKMNNSLHNLKIVPARRGRTKKPPRAVVMIDREGRVVARYGSARRAALENHVCVDSVLNRCHMEVPADREYTLAGGRTFRFDGGAECTE